MQLNSALFGLNGCTGYVLQPEFMRLDSYDPYQEKKMVKYVINVKVLQPQTHTPWCSCHITSTQTVLPVGMSTRRSGELYEDRCVGSPQVIAARHLPKLSRSIVSPFVEIELCGHTEEKFKTIVYRKCFREED